MATPIEPGDRVNHKYGLDGEVGTVMPERAPEGRLWVEWDDDASARTHYGVDYLRHVSITNEHHGLPARLGTLTGTVHLLRGAPRPGIDTAGDNTGFMPPADGPQVVLTGPLVEACDEDDRFLPTLADAELVLRQAANASRRQLATLTAEARSLSEQLAASQQSEAATVTAARRSIAELHQQIDTRPPSSRTNAQVEAAARAYWETITADGATGPLKGIPGQWKTWPELTDERRQQHLDAMAIALATADATPVAILTTSELLAHVVEAYGSGGGPSRYAEGGTLPAPVSLPLRPVEPVAWAVTNYDAMPDEDGRVNAFATREAADAFVMETGEGLIRPLYAGEVDGLTPEEPTAQRSES